MQTKSCSKYYKNKNGIIKYRRDCNTCRNYYLNYTQHNIYNWY